MGIDELSVWQARVSADMVLTLLTLIIQGFVADLRVCWITQEENMNHTRPIQWEVIN